MNERKLTLEEVKTIARFVAGLKKGDRWLLFSWNPQAKELMGFETPQGISPANMVRIAQYMLKGVPEDMETSIEIIKDLRRELEKKSGKV